MSDRILRGASTVAVFICAAASAGFIFVFLRICLARASYPFDLEWMEGAMVDHVDRIISGQALYAPPSIDFVPFIYNPLYYYLAVPPTLILGVSHLPLRLVSIAATLACFALVFALVWKETRRLVPSLFAVGLFAATFELTAGWFDLARVDTTCVAFCLGAWYAARWTRTSRGAVVAASLVACAFLTKQAALAVFPALVLATILLHGFRRSLWFVPVIVAVCAVMGLLEITSHGWYSYYAFAVPAGHPHQPDLVREFWKQEIFSEVSLALGLALYFAFTAADRIEGTVALQVHGPFIACMVVMAYLMRVHSGSWWNDRMPAYAALAVGAGLGLGELFRSKEGVTSHRARIVGSAVALAQLAFLVYSPEHWVPNDDDVLEGETFVSAVKKCQGEVFLTHHGAITRSVGKPSFAHGMAVIDVLRSSRDYRGAQQSLRASFANAFASHRFCEVFTDDRLLLPELVDTYYERAPFGYNPNMFLTRVGTYRPRNAYVPKHPTLAP